VLASASLRIASTALVLVSTAACGGTDFVHDEWEAKPLDTSDSWLEGGPRGKAKTAQAPKQGTRSAETFRNTYYDFPTEGSGDKKAKVFDAQCKPIASVTQAFHDQVCLQGSGRLMTGETISFAIRDCTCAAECPKSNQKICFEKLDAKAFPSGRGASGKAIRPLKSIAVDTEVIALGQVVFIPEYEGLSRPDGTKHDGCFVAEDRGSKVVGKHIDIFTGDPSTTKVWNQLVPSNQGVHVEIGAPRCDHLKAR
jgi:3D (Asp-Asp-Asp) domain-containing protein